MFTALAAIFNSFLAVLNFIIERRKKSGKGTYAKDIKEFNEALAKGDTDSLSIKFNELCKPGLRDSSGPDNKEAG